MIRATLFSLLWTFRSASPGIVRKLLHRLDGVRHWRLRGARIGKDCGLLSGVDVSEPYLLEPGVHVSLSTAAQLITHDGAVWVLRGPGLACVTISDLLGGCLTSKTS